MRLVEPDAWTTTPWRNGGGITHEIAREGPPDAFAWRVSVAEVAHSGPFSHFHGVDRYISLVEGDGFALRGPHSWQRTSLIRVGELHRFSGDDATDCHLLGGPVRDFNLMVDRNLFESSCVYAECDPGPNLFRAAGGLLLVFVLDGVAQVDDGGWVSRHSLIISDVDLHLSPTMPTDLLVARLVQRDVPNPGPSQVG
jgi:uncharacterized protein